MASMTTDKQASILLKSDFMNIAAPSDLHDDPLEIGILSGGPAGLPAAA